MMRVFSFVGSCAGESSRTLEVSNRLVAVLATLAKTHDQDLVYDCVNAGQLQISFCRSCNSCFKTGVCPLDAQDDIGELKQKMLEADIVLLGSPVYLTGMSGVTKCVIDRIAYWTHRLELAGKAGMALVTASNNHGPQVEQRLRELMQYMGLAVPQGLYLQQHANPHLNNPEEADPVIKAAAKRLFDAWKDPATQVTQQQEMLYKGLKLRTHRSIMKSLLYGEEPFQEALVFDKRKIGSCSTFADYIRQRREPQ